MWLITIVAVAILAGLAVVRWAERTQDELIDALIKRDESAFRWLVQKHWGSMIRVATGLLRNESLAVEVVQETWEIVLKEISRFRRESSLSTWMYRIMVNRAHRVGKREGRTVPLTSFKSKDNDDGNANREDEFSSNGRWRSPVHGWRMIDPENEAMNREGLKLLGEGLEKLPEKQKIIVTLRDVEGLGSKEVCEMLEISEGNQRILLHRGRTKLRQLLEQAELSMRTGKSGVAR